MTGYRVLRKAKAFKYRITLNSDSSVVRCGLGSTPLCVCVCVGRGGGDIYERLRSHHAASTYVASFLSLWAFRRIFISVSWM